MTIWSLVPISLSHHSKDYLDNINIGEKQLLIHTCFKNLINTISFQLPTESHITNINT